MDYISLLLRSRDCAREFGRMYDPEADAARFLQPCRDLATWQLDHVKLENLPAMSEVIREPQPVFDEQEFGRYFYSKVITVKKMRLPEGMPAEQREEAVRAMQREYEAQFQVQLAPGTSTPWVAAPHGAPLRPRRGYTAKLDFFCRELKLNMELELELGNEATFWVHWLHKVPEDERSRYHALSEEAGQVYKTRCGQYQAALKMEFQDPEVTPPPRLWSAERLGQLSTDWSRDGAMGLLQLADLYTGPIIHDRYLNGEYNRTDVIQALVSAAPQADESSSFHNMMPMLHLLCLPSGPREK
ncbi:hypothetical protein CYMTET_14066 [Cymbomonas tetramitiformis]|uniref:Uncharacterized protein n=1 Tax=Cymbomonas tetramitiformis TaxID=36881 RepID=A0AAE0LAK8_9CHLO|nr:hypothetical protein CYMTET_14066 [Cymbomonas tetramitiformis]